MQDSKEKTEIAENIEKTEKTEKPRKKIYRWIEIFAFLIVYAVILKVISYATDPVRLDEPEYVVSRDKTAYAALAEDEDIMDVLILGDSEAMVMCSPKVLMKEAGIASYNCHQLGQRISEAYFFLEKILKKQHPKVLIFETNVIVHETSIKLEPQLTFNAMTQEWFPFLRYHSNWRYIFGLVEPELYDLERGYEEIATVDPYSGEEYMFETDETAWLDPITVHYLNKIRELCDENGISLVLVSSPSAINMDYPKHNALQKYSDKYGIAFIDFNLMTDEIGLDWSEDTGDKGDHINMYGGEKTTRYLMNYLKENYDLPDHRED